MGNDIEITAEFIEAARQTFLTDDQKNMPWHDRLPEFDMIDRIEIDIVPRYKTSGLSGDEWRQSVCITAYFKGLAVFTEGVRDIEVACGMLYSFRCKASDSGIPEEVLTHERKCCDQPSCTNKATNWYLLKKIHSQGNHIEAPAMERSNGRGYYRKFCNRHAERGDCCLNDTDRNYVPVIGSPENSSRPDEDLSPSAGPIIL